MKKVYRTVFPPLQIYIPILEVYFYYWVGAKWLKQRLTVLISCHITFPEYCEHRENLNKIFFRKYIDKLTNLISKYKNRNQRNSFFLIKIYWRIFTCYKICDTHYKNNFWIWVEIKRNNWKTKLIFYYSDTKLVRFLRPIRFFVNKK